MPKTSKPRKPAVLWSGLLAELEVVRRRLKKLRLTLEKGEWGRSYCDVWKAEELIEKVQNRERSHSANTAVSQPGQPLSNTNNPSANP
jgi:hypothetical protein